jgi:hypothetical protein
MILVLFHLSEKTEYGNARYPYAIDENGEKMGESQRKISGFNFFINIFFIP